MEMPLIRCWTLGCGQLGLSEVQGTVLSTRMGTLVLMAAQGHSGKNKTGSGCGKTSKSVSAVKPTEGLPSLLASTKPHAPSPEARVSRSMDTGLWKILSTCWSCPTTQQAQEELEESPF